MYFIYPETCGVRLEDMDVLFGDASTIVGSPSLRGETESLMPSAGSPIGSAVGSDFRGRPSFTATGAIPNMSLDPPEVGNDDKPSSPTGEPPTVGSWLARVVNRSRSRASSRASGSGSGSGRYAPVRQQGDE